MPVQFDHVSVHQYPGHKTYKAVVRLPGTRRSLSIEVGPIAATERPARGELVPAYGFRNWLGLTIDGIALRERASADAQ